MQTLPSLVVFVALSACIDPRSMLPVPGEAPREPAEVAGAPSNALPGAAMASTPQLSTATHRVLGIVDPERDKMVAFALKVPVGWAASQSFTRLADGAASIPQVTLRLRSPDGNAQIEYRPLISHMWSDGPMSRSVRQQKREFGMDPRLTANELEPMQATAYVRQVILPRLAQEGIVVSGLRNEVEVPEERVSASEIKRRGSVDGTLPDGQLVRVECRVRITVQPIEQDTYYSWVVVPSITQSRGDLEAAYAHTRVAQDSLITNPTWQQLEQAAQQRGQQANSEESRRQHDATMGTIEQNTAAMTAGHNARMADIQRQGDANTARYNDRMDAMDQSHAAWQENSASQDRQQQYTIDGIREESRYVDPSTGERVVVQDGYDNVYRADDGQSLGSTTILATEAPLDPQQVDWQQLQKLSLSEY